MRTLFAAAIVAALTTAAQAQQPPTIQQQRLQHAERALGYAIQSGDPATIAAATRMLELERGVQPPPATTSTCYPGKKGTYTCYQW